MAQHVHDRYPVATEMTFHSLAEVTSLQDAGVDDQINVIARRAQRRSQLSGVLGRIVKVSEQNEVRLILIRGTNWREAADTDTESPPRSVRHC